MSEPMHFWASGMPRATAQNYLLDLCGDASQNFTETESEVTCERCLAALRGAPAPDFAGESRAGKTLKQRYDELGFDSSDLSKAAHDALDACCRARGPRGFGPSVVETLDSAVRAAVLKERAEILETAQAMIAMTSRKGEFKTALRQLVDEIKRRG